MAPSTCGIQRETSSPSPLEGLSPFASPRSDDGHFGIGKSGDEEPGGWAGGGLRACPKATTTVDCALWGLQSQGRSRLTRQPRLDLGHPAPHGDVCAWRPPALHRSPALQLIYITSGCFGFFFPDICYYFHLKRQGIPPSSSCPPPLRAAQGWAEGPAGAGGARNGLEHALLQIPPQHIAGSQGKKKKPKPRNTNWTQKGRCRLNRKRWPEAKWNSCCHCSAFANSARLGLREQMLAITAHEKKGTGLGKWRKSKGTARFITGGARQPLSGGRRQPAPRCPCPGRGYSAGTRRQSPGRPRTGSPATPGPPRQGPGPPGDAFPRRCFAKAKVAAEGSGSSRRDLPTGSRGEPSSAARDLLGAAEPRQIFTSCQWRLTLLVPSRGIPPGVGGAGRAGLSLRANFISSSLCTTGTKNKQTKHKLYIPCEISSGLPYNQSCKIKIK